MQRKQRLQERLMPQERLRQQKKQRKQRSLRHREIIKKTEKDLQGMTDRLTETASQEAKEQTAVSRTDRLIRMASQEAKEQTAVSRTDRLTETVSKGVTVSRTDHLIRMDRRETAKVIRTEDVRADLNLTKTAIMTENRESVHRADRIKTAISQCLFLRLNWYRNLAVSRSQRLIP